MSLLLGLVVAASFGSGDFLGGVASKRARTIAVLVTVQLCALVGALAVAPIAAVVGSVIPVVWGLASGEDPATAALVGVELAVEAAGLI